ncbi:MAG TPA: acyltransferase, partial [Caldilinea sp.]|nr:acyltransferase [Caldilinea sp.]
MKSADTYMRHVDGLRALAVLSVILYHLGVRQTPGGYVGVDVFFVISGFLITRLIYEELRTTGRFDFARFYIRRMRRLFPALFVTLAITTGAAMMVLSPGAFAKFGASLAAATVSISNILFWNEAGYFDSDSFLKPLLHTWSLSVEEQFYLIWPAFLWLLMSRWSMRGAAVAGALVAIGIASFALNALWVHGDFNADYQYAIFFLTPFRVFEFVIGGLGLFLLNAVRDRIVLQDVFMAVGLALIGYSIATFDKTLVFPYWHGLLPSFGTLLVILSGQSLRVGPLLTNRAAVFTGLISYSLYLVHWPLIVFYNYISLAPRTAGNQLALIAATFALAYLLYRFIETPFRKGTPTAARLNPQRAFVMGSLGAMLVSCVLGGTIWLQDGWSWRQPQALTAAQIDSGMQRRYATGRSPRCNILALAEKKRCKMDRPFQVLVFGNSHEPDAYNAFDAIYGSNPDVNLITFGTTNGCNLEIAGGVPNLATKVRDCKKRFDIIADAAFVSKLG